MKLECSAIKEKVFCILYVISLFTAWFKKKNLSDILQVC